MSKNRLDQVQIRELLPHRYPFIMVDVVREVDPHKSIVAIKNVTNNEPYFTGHFPQKPIMPGVMILEALAQAGGVLVFHSNGWVFTGDDDLFYLAGVDNARFKRMVEAGDQLELRVQIVKQRLTVWRLHGEAYVDGELCCSADLLVSKGK